MTLALLLQSMSVFWPVQFTVKVNNQEFVPIHDFGQVQCDGYSSHCNCTPVWWVFTFSRRQPPSPTSYCCWRAGWLHTRRGSQWWFSYTLNLSPQILRYTNNGCIIRELLEVIVRLNRESDVCKEEGKEEGREPLFTPSDFWLSNTLLVWLQEFSLIQWCYWLKSSRLKSTYHVTIRVLNVLWVCVFQHKTEQSTY